jgi:hypothetical protein
MKQLFRLAHEEARKRAEIAVQQAPDFFIVTIQEPTRSLDANARLWATLNEIAKQVIWHGRKLDAESWKHIFSSSLKKQDVVPNLDGTGFVAMGLSTSKMSKREFSDLLELINSFAAEHGVKLMDERAAE